MNFSNTYTIYPANKHLEKAIGHYVSLVPELEAGAAKPDTDVTVLDSFRYTRGTYEQQRYSTNVLADAIELFEAALPYTTEIHLKNTDAIFNSTFGFMAEEREKGIVDIGACRSLLLREAERLPVRDIVGYLEINGPKTGRDYSDRRLEQMLRESLRWCKQEFET